MWRCGRCVASQSAFGWGDSPLSVAVRCLGYSVRAWLGTVAMWRVSARLIGECRYVASQCSLDWRLSLCGVAMWRCGRCVASQSALGWGDSPLSVAGRCLGESVRAWLGTVAMRRVSARLVGDCRCVALRPLRGESIRAWLGRLAIERCGPLPWRVSPRLIGDCRDVASQSALGWGLSRCGESVRTWLGTVAMWRCGRCVASHSALDWGDSLLSVVGRCLGESIRT
ncbi:hypothetical protein ACLB2K_040878 [Fragaria x ananassa]